MQNYIIQLSYNDHSFSCVANQKGQNSLGLNPNGVTWNNPTSPLQLHVENDEIFIQNNNPNISASVQRNGRMRFLRPGNTIRLLPNDTIRVDSLTVIIKNIYKSSSSILQNLIASLKSASCPTMLAMTAALLLSMPFNGCSTNIENDFGETGDVPPVDKDLNELPDNCREKSGQDLKTCCLAVENSDDREKCCHHLTNTSGLSCQDPKPETAPPLCHDMKTGQDLKNCCLAIEDDNARTQCCDRLESEFAMTCAEELGGALPEPKPACIDKSGQDLKECCEAQDEGYAHDECCARLQQDFDLECAPTVPEITAGLPIRIPACFDLYEAAPEELKSCCMALTNDDDKSECCSELESKGLHCD